LAVDGLLIGKQVVEALHPLKRGATMPSRGG
jgi:hypothetical protein